MQNDGWYLHQGLKCFVGTEVGPDQSTLEEENKNHCNMVEVRVFSLHRSPSMCSMGPFEPFAVPKKERTLSFKFF